MRRNHTWIGYLENVMTPTLGVTVKRRDTMGRSLLALATTPEENKYTAQNQGRGDTAESEAEQ